MINLHLILGTICLALQINHLTLHPTKIPQKNLPHLFPPARNKLPNPNHPPPNPPKTPPVHLLYHTFQPLHQILPPHHLQNYLMFLALDCLRVSAVT